MKAQRTAHIDNTNGEDKMSDESRIVRVETVIEHIDYRLDQIDKSFDKLDEKINKIDNKINNGTSILETKMDLNFNRLEIKTDTNFKWIVGMMITLFVLNGFVPAITKLVARIFL